MTVFQRRNNVSLSTLNERQSLTLKQRWFWVHHKNIFAFMSSTLLVYENIHEILSFSVIVHVQIFSLVESCFIEIGVLLPVTLQKELKLVLWVCPEQILFRGVFKPSPNSKIEFIRKIVFIYKSFDYFL